MVVNVRLAKAVSTCSVVGCAGRLKAACRVEGKRGQIYFCVVVLFVGP
jgi:hypothetical protein